MPFDHEVLSNIIRAAQELRVCPKGPIRADIPESQALTAGLPDWFQS
jgi:hypothetical protein